MVTYTELICSKPVDVTLQYYCKEVVLFFLVLTVVDGNYSTAAMKALKAATLEARVDRCMARPVTTSGKSWSAVVFNTNDSSLPFSAATSRSIHAEKRYCRMLILFTEGRLINGRTN